MSTRVRLSTMTRSSTATVSAIVAIVLSLFLYGWLTGNFIVYGNWSSLGFLCSAGTSG